MTGQSANFLGLPIEGDITRGSTRKEQRPVEELTPLFEAVFAEGIIDGVRWTQYTPYFNDGDACEFGANEVDVHFASNEPDSPSLVAQVQKALDENWSAAAIVELVQEHEDDEDDEDEDEYDGEWSDDEGWTHGGANWDTRFNKEVGEFRYSLVGETVLNMSAPHPQTANAVCQLSEAIEGGEFDNVLLELFGDHAQVQVVKGKAIHVEGYSHD